MVDNIHPQLLTPIGTPADLCTGHQGEAVVGDQGKAEEPIGGVLRFTAADVIKAEWFLEPYIARAMVTVLVGEQGTGKSTFATFLMTKAKRTIFLPGEEDIKRVALPRVLVGKVDPKTVTWVPCGEGWQFPRHRDKLIDLIKKEEADLVVIDPLDDYFGDGLDEDRNQHVRAVLQSLREVAELTGAAIVIIRHPGKAKENVMVGSRAWGNHPRAILRFVRDPDVRDRGIFQPHKPPLGRWFPAMRYELEGNDGEFRRFALKGEVGASEAREAVEVTDRHERRKIDQAVNLLSRVLEGGAWHDSRDVYKFFDPLRISDRTVRDAADRLGVEMRQTGTRKETVSEWRLPPKGPMVGGK